MKYLQTLILSLLCFETFSQQSVYVTIGGGDLYKLELDNQCNSLFIGSTGLGFGDIAFTPDGRLWGIVGESLYQINPLNATVSLVGNFGLSAISLEALDNNTLLVEANQNLYGININDASISLIGNIGYSAIGDLTWYDNDLYMASVDFISSAAVLIKIVLNETYTAILSSAPVNSILNPIPPCEGLATVSFSDLHNSIIGFSGQNIYEICYLDGSYQLLCETIVPNGIPGGASIRFPIQNPQPQLCQFLAVIEHPIPNIIVQICPNPFSSHTVLKLSDSLNNLSLTILNCYGQKVKEINNISEQTITLYSDNLSRGMYFILFEKNGHLIGKEKLIVNN